MVSFLEGLLQRGNVHVDEVSSVVANSLQVVAVEVRARLMIFSVLFIILFGVVDDELIHLVVEGIPLLLVQFVEFRADHFPQTNLDPSLDDDLDADVEVELITPITIDSIDEGTMLKISSKSDELIKCIYITSHHSVFNHINSIRSG